MAEILAKLESKTEKDETERRKMVNVVKVYLLHGHTPAGISKLLHISEESMKFLLEDIDESIIEEAYGA